MKIHRSSPSIGFLNTKYLKLTGGTMAGDLGVGDGQFYFHTTPWVGGAALRIKGTAIDENVSFQIFGNAVDLSSEANLGNAPFRLDYDVSDGWGFGAYSGVFAVNEALAATAKLVGVTDNGLAFGIDGTNTRAFLGNKDWGGLYAYLKVDNIAITDKTFQFPNATGTLAILELAQTFTKAQTITPTANATNTFGVTQADGTTVFNVDTTNGRIATNELRALSASGLKLYDDGGNGIFVKDGGNVGIGTTTPGAKLQVDAGAAATIGQIIKGAASQSANLQEWQDSSASILSHVNADGSFHIGGATNYTEIKADGEIIRHGTARTTNALWIDAGGIKAPGTKPATYVSQGLIGVWQFADQAVEANQEHVSSNMRIPKRTDRTVALELIIGWSADGISPGNCEWQLEYLWRSPNEDTTAAAQETLTQTTAASATSNGVTMTTFTGIDLPSDTDGGIYFRITRLSAGANDTIADTVELAGVMLNFTSDKLGQAT